jgi:hypothetical protein
MQFLYSLFLIATLFISLQAMEPEAFVHAGQEAAESAAEKARTAIAAEQPLISTYPTIFENTILNGLPTEIKKQFIEKLSNATSIAAVEYYLEDLSNKDKSMRIYIEAPKFKDRWLEFVHQVATQIGHEEVKKASKARDLLRTQQKAAARVKPEPQKKEVAVKPEQTSIPIVSELLETTLFKDLPDIPKKQILSYFSKATTIEGIGNVLRQISTGPLFRKYLTMPEFTDRWLQFAQQITEEDIKQRSKKWWDPFGGTPKIPMSEVRINALRANENGNLTMVQNRALLALGTDDALDRYIKALDPNKIQSDAGAAIEYIANPSDRFYTVDKRYVPLLIRLLKTKRFNPDHAILFSERVGNQVEFILQAPLMYVLRHENNDPYLVKLLLEAGAPVKDPLWNPLETATKNINGNTLDNILLLIAAKADIKNQSNGALINALKSDHPESKQILGTLLDHGAPITRELRQQLQALLAKPNQDATMLRIKRDFITNYDKGLVKPAALKK